jgi:nicotinate-nucleotide pyrophosphorylase (carboxylating)
LPEAGQSANGDLREQIFASLDGRLFAAGLIAGQAGILSGIQTAAAQAEGLGLQVGWRLEEGSELQPGEVIARLEGSATQITRGEERLLGCLCKASGIASAARGAAKLAAGRVRVVCGAWKKMPPELKGYVRQAVETGGLPTRILDQPFVYLDKNYVRLLGGIVQTLRAVHGLPGVKVIQVRGYNGQPVAEETRLACLEGAGVVMVDTGRLEDALAALEAAQAFPQVQVAFAGGVQLEDIPRLAGLGLHILDIGAAIIDAPLLEIKLEVMENRHGI